MNKTIEESIVLLDGWVEKNGWNGYDPYDIKGNPNYRLLYRYLSESGSPTIKIIKIAIENSEVICPLLMRKIFRVQKQVNPKGMGLFARAYIDLYKSTNVKKYQDKAKHIFDWLRENPSKGYSGLCWGYPFDWQSYHFLPKATPSSVVSACIGDAFFGYYRVFRNRRYLDICQRICNFFINDLNVDYISKDKICFSYTPIDKHHVHNANLFAAEFLIRIGNEIGSKKYIDLGKKALNYTLCEQNQDGSFYYFGSQDETLYNLSEEELRRIDHYHTGFVLRSLSSIYKTIQDKNLFYRIQKCYRHYSQNLFENKTIPKFTPDSKYPINIHSCAEAILCMSTLCDLFPDALEHAQNVFLWTKSNMQNKEGWFIYMIINMKGIKWKVRIPYIRWGQAWMLRALSQYYSSLRCRES
jgi:hypothetical protein